MESEKSGDSELTFLHPVLYPHHWLPLFPFESPGTAFIKACMCLTVRLLLSGGFLIWSLSFLHPGFYFPPRTNESSII